MAAASSVAPAQSQHRSTRLTRALKHRPRSSISSATSNETCSDVLDVENLRRVRADYYDTPLDDRRSISSPQMAHDREQGRHDGVRDESRVDVAAGSHGIRSRSHTSHRHRRRKQKNEETADDGVYVYKSMDEMRVRRSTASLRTPGPESDRSTNLLPDRRRFLRTLGLDRQNRPTGQTEGRQTSRPASIRRSSSHTGREYAETRGPRRLGSDSDTLRTSHKPRVAR